MFKSVKLTRLAESLLEFVGDLMDILNWGILPQRGEMSRPIFSSAYYALLCQAEDEDYDFKKITYLNNNKNRRYYELLLCMKPTIILKLQRVACMLLFRSAYLVMISSQALRIGTLKLNHMNPLTGIYMRAGV